MTIIESYPYWNLNETCSFWTRAGKSIESYPYWNLNHIEKSAKDGNLYIESYPYWNLNIMIQPEAVPAARH